MFFLTVGFSRAHHSDLSLTPCRGNNQTLFDIEGRTHGHNRSDRGYPLPATRLTFQTAHV